MRSVFTHSLDHVNVGRSHRLERSLQISHFALERKLRVLIEQTKRAYRVGEMNDAVEGDGKSVEIRLVLGDELRVGGIDPDVLVHVRKLDTVGLELKALTFRDRFEAGNLNADLDEEHSVLIDY